MASKQFDAYYQWLGIAPKDQPPNHYRLLGVDVFEGDLNVIESAADRQMSHVRSFQSGPHGDASQKLLNKITAARLCLLNAAKKAEYDAALPAEKSAASAAERPKARAIRNEHALAKPKPLNRAEAIDRHSKTPSPNLGDPLEVSEADLVSVAVSRSSRSAPPPARRRRVLMFLLCALPVAVVVAIAFSMFGNPDQNQSTSTEDDTTKGTTAQRPQPEKGSQHSTAVGGAEDGSQAPDGVSPRTQPNDETSETGPPNPAETDDPPVSPPPAVDTPAVDPPTTSPLPGTEPPPADPVANGEPSPPVEEAPAKIAVPDDVRLQAANQLIDEVYKSDIDAADSSEELVELADQLRTDANAVTDDDCAQYALLQRACQIASAAGEVDKAFGIVAEIALRFEADEFDLKRSVLAESEKPLKESDDLQSHLERISDLIEEAVSVDRFDVARSLGEPALSIARRIRDPELTKTVGRRNLEVKELEKQFAAVEAAQTVLDGNPSDPKANLTVGNYRCFVKRDWQAGLPLLASGGDRSLKELAEQELADRPDAVSLGDAWWAYGEQQSGQDAEAAKAHASDWYREGLPELTGLAKARVERRIADFPLRVPASSEDLDDAEARLTLSSDQAKTLSEYKTLVDQALRLSERAERDGNRAAACRFAISAASAADAAKNEKLIKKANARLKKLFASARTELVSAELEWQPVFDVKQGDLIIVTAMGTWNVGGGNDEWNSRADGVGGPRDGAPVPELSIGTLIGRIGNDVFAVGHSAEIEVREDGKLELRCNDSGTQDNHGALTVTVGKLK